MISTLKFVHFMVLAATLAKWLAFKCQNAGRPEAMLLFILLHLVLVYFGRLKVIITLLLLSYPTIPIS